MSAVNRDTNANQLVLANATELGVRVIMKVSGNAIANTVDGQRVTPPNLADTITARFQANLAKHMETV